MHLSYEPVRLAELTRRSGEAASALLDVRSDDPAADDALAAVSVLRRAVDALGSTAANILIVDPLGSRDESRRRLPGGFLPTPAVERRTHLSPLTDAELIELMAEALDWADPSVVENPDHHFFTEDLVNLAIEFRRRSADDPAFLDWMIATAGTNPLIGLVVAQGGFPDEVLADVAVAVASDGVSAFASGTLRSVTIDALMVRLAERPDVAATVLADPDAFERLTSWNALDHTVRPIDATTFERILVDSLHLSLDDPAHLGTVSKVIANVVSAANSREFDLGFPPGLAEAITVGIVPHLPAVISSLGDEVVFVEDSSGHRFTEIGDREEVRDLFGALLRDAHAQSLLLATITPLTHSADTTAGRQPYSLAAVGLYVDTLTTAADGEILEQSIVDARSRSGWAGAVEAVADLIDAGLAFYPPAKILKIPLDAFEAGALWLVRGISSGGIGVEEFEFAAHVMFSIGLASVIVSSPTSHDETDHIGTVSPGVDDGDRADPDAVLRRLEALRVALDGVPDGRSPGGDDGDRSPEQSEVHRRLGDLLDQLDLDARSRRALSDADLGRDAGDPDDDTDVAG